MDSGATIVSPNRRRRRNDNRLRWRGLRRDVTRKNEEKQNKETKSNWLPFFSKQPFLVGRGTCVAGVTTTTSARSCSVANTLNVRLLICWLVIKENIYLAFFFQYLLSGTVEKTTDCAVFFPRVSSSAS